MNELGERLIPFCRAKYDDPDARVHDVTKMPVMVLIDRGGVVREVVPEQARARCQPRGDDRRVIHDQRSGDPLPLRREDRDGGEGRRVQGERSLDEARGHLASRWSATRSTLPRAVRGIVSTRTMLLGTL